MIEVLVAGAIVVLVAFAGLAACTMLAQVLLRAQGTGRSAADIDAQTTRMRDDAASAQAVFVPPSGMDGGPNAGREVDFASATDGGRPVLWRFAYDAAKHTLQRWDYDPDGTRGVRAVATGVIDTTAVYPPLKGITRFSATAIAADQLGEPGLNTYAGIAPIFTRAPRALPVRYDGLGAGLPGVIGGNGIVEITLANAVTARVIHLAAGALPTGFTITGVPVWHAIVYRVDQSHRFLLGAAGKSHVFINAHVDVSYDGWASRISWCDFNLLGNPDGLDGDDPHATYTPLEAFEESDSILAQCRVRHPVPPDRGSIGNPPDPDALHPPLPGQTAPPCWVQPGPGGRCWPADAPPDWTPPAPAPLDTPPPAWCATHAASIACGGGPPGERGR